MTIGQPYYEPTSNDDEEDVEEPEEENEDTGVDKDEEDHENRFDSDTGEPLSSDGSNSGKLNPTGCSTVSSRPNWFLALICLLGIRKRQ